MTFIVGWTEDRRMLQFLGEVDAKDGEEAIDKSASNHKQEGLYIAVPIEHMTQKMVTFDQVAILTDPPPPKA